MKMKEIRPRGMRLLLGSAKCNEQDLKKNRKWQFTATGDFSVVDTGPLAKFLPSLSKKPVKSPPPDNG